MTARRSVNCRTVGAHRVPLQVSALNLADCPVPLKRTAFVFQTQYGLDRAAAEGMSKNAPQIAQHEQSIVQERERYMAHFRSEERRVGKECRSWWSPYH